MVSGPPVPAESYFTAYGLRKSYGAPAETYPYFAGLVAARQLAVDSSRNLFIAGPELINELGNAAPIRTAL